MVEARLCLSGPSMTLEKLICITGLISGIRWCWGLLEAFYGVGVYLRLFMGLGLSLGVLMGLGLAMGFSKGFVA